jgi:hypothetical protein
MAVLQWLSDALDSHAPQGIPYPAEEDRVNAVWRTSIADTDLIKGVYERASGDRYINPYKSLRSGLVHDEKTAITAGAAGYLGRIRNRNFGRRPFISSEGLIGLGVDDVEVHDLIVIIVGANVPFLLRPYEIVRYRLVGDVYVHGIMDGEKMDSSPAPERFELY